MGEIQTITNDILYKHVLIYDIQTISTFELGHFILIRTNTERATLNSLTSLSCVGL